MRKMLYFIQQFCIRAEVIGSADTSIHTHKSNPIFKMIHQDPRSSYRDSSLLISSRRLDTPALAKIDFR